MVSDERQTRRVVTGPRASGSPVGLGRVRPRLPKFADACESRSRLVIVGCCGSDGSCGGEGMGSGGGGAPSSSISRSPRSTRSTMKSPTSGAGRSTSVAPAKGGGAGLDPTLPPTSSNCTNYPTLTRELMGPRLQSEPVLSPAARRRQGTSPLPRVLGADSERGPPFSTRARSRFGA
jgi:hypothetical protein